jgi:transposase-like protein
MLQEWKVHPLEEIYPFLFLDAIHYKVREEGQYISKAFYTVLGVRLDGKKEILGLYLGESEGAKFWLQVLTDLQNRGVKDILIASVDGLKGFPEAINAVFPKHKYSCVSFTKYATASNLLLLKIKSSSLKN